MAVTNMGWPSEHEAALPDLIAAGLSGAQIAVVLNKRFNTDYSRNAVIGKATRMKKQLHGLAGPRKNPNKPGYRAGKAVPGPKAWQAPRPMRPREVVEAACAAIVPKGIRCEDLDETHCRWPYGEGPFTFCGHNRIGDPDKKSALLPYCCDHWHLSCGDGSRSERRATEGIRRDTL